MSQQLSILHGVLSLDVGGLERVVLSLVQEGTRRGHRITIVCIEKAGELAIRARRLGAGVICLDKPPGRHRGYIDRARDVIDRIRPDMIHTHQIGAAWYLGTAARKSKIPVLHTEHGNQFARDAGWIARLKSRLFYRITSRLIGRFCCVSSEIANSVARFGIVSRTKISVVPNGIDLPGDISESERAAVRSEYGIPIDAFVIGTVGRLAEVKRQDRLLKAAAELSSRFPNVWVLVVGEGPERDRLDQLAISLGIRERVRMVGYQTHPNRFLRAMDVFALTSRSEGLPISLLEAWASRLPVVSTRVGAIPDVISEGIDGLIVPNDDGPCLCRAISKLLTDPDFANKLGMAGYQTVRHRFSLETMARTYDSEYRALISHLRGIG